MTQLPKSISNVFQAQTATRGRFRGWLTLALPSVALVALLATPSNAWAQAGEAEVLNDEGRALFADGKYFDAYKKFKSAAELAPKGKFFFNICFSLNFLERYTEAVAACEQVEPNGADDRLVEKTNSLLEELRKRVPATEPGLDPDGPGPDPDNPDNPDNPNTGTNTGTNFSSTNNTVTVGRPPPGPVQPNAFVKGSAPNLQAYRWAIGGELGFFGNMGIGARDGFEYFEASGVSLRVNANFLLSERRRLGVQAHLGYAALGAGDDSPNDDDLNLVEVGGGIFMHFPITPKIVLTPLVGLDFVFYQVGSDSNALVGLGVRGEGSVAFLFGPGGKHAITATPALTLYSAAAGGDDTIFTPAQLNLDQPAASLGVTVGYTMRFTTPFGSTPLITLE